MPLFCRTWKNPRQLVAAMCQSHGFPVLQRAHKQTSFRAQLRCRNRFHGSSVAFADSIGKPCFDGDGADGHHDDGRLQEKKKGRQQQATEKQQIGNLPPFSCSSVVLVLDLQRFLRGRRKRSVTDSKRRSSFTNRWSFHPSPLERIVEPL